MACRIGINGFGRIGRMVLRRTLTMPDVEVVAVNDLAHIGDLAYLLKYDSVHGLFPGDVSHDEQAILVNGTAMQFSSEKDAAKIPWGRAGVDVVIESTGAFRGRKDAAGHLQGGARKILISAPSDDVDVTLSPGSTRRSMTRHSTTCSPWPRARRTRWRRWPKSCTSTLASPTCLLLPSTPIRPVNPSWISQRANAGGAAPEPCR